MWMTIAVLASPDNGRPDSIDVSIVVDILWAVVLPRDRIEHIHVRAGPGQIDVVVYHLTHDTASAVTTVVDLCLRAVQGSPWLRGWTVRGPYP